MTPDEINWTPDLKRKMVLALEGVLDIHQAPNERDAIIAALIALETLNYPQVMISFLQEVEGERRVIADPEYSIGDKWSLIAKETNRSYDEPSDILPMVLREGKAVFIADSREHSNCDRQLCRDMNLITQYIMPLVRDKMEIGTIQVDMGRLDEKPELECKMLDAFAAHLSSAVHSHRVDAKLQEAMFDLFNAAKIVDYNASTALVHHELSHKVGDFLTALKKAMINPTIRQNDASLSFLRQSEKKVLEWIQLLTQSFSNLKSSNHPKDHDIGDLIEQTIKNWIDKAMRSKCIIRGTGTGRGIQVHLPAGAFRELLSCLIINAIEARARNIWIEASQTWRNGGDQKRDPYAEIIVADDGDGIPSTHIADIRKFGWTSKRRTGKGMGLTIVDLLAKSLGGTFSLTSGGLSAGQPRTEFRVLIPLHG